MGTFCVIQPTPREWTEFDMEVMRELTASIMSEINLRNQVSKLQKAQNLRDTFISALTHDLRTPLTAAKITAQTVIRKHEGLPDIVMSMEKVIRSLNRAEGLIRNLLDANQISSGMKLSLKIVPCCFNEILDQAIKELSVIYGNRFVVEAESVVNLEADASALRRIIDNLISNAAKYSPDESPIVVLLRSVNNVVKFCVKNSGDPIPLDEQLTIFEPFQRAVNAIEGNQQGWGLGLPLVKGLVESHGGNISLISNTEEGTCFSIELPLS